MIGPRKKWVDTLCGIMIKMKDVSSCNTVQDTLEDVGQQFMQKTTAMCQCILNTLDLIGKELLNEVAAHSDISSTISSILAKFAKMQMVRSYSLSTCLTDSHRFRR